MSVEEELHNVISNWHKRVQQVQDAHYESGSYYEKLYLGLGISMIVLSALVGGIEVLVPAENMSSISDKIDAKKISGAISLIVAILAGLQTFLKFGQRSERHHMAGARYGDSRRALEEITIICEESSKAAKIELHRIKKQIDSLADKSPEVPQRILKKYRPKDYAIRHLSQDK